MALYKRVPTQIVIAAYHNKDGADKALAQLVDALQEKQIVCTNVAIAKMDKKGRVRVKELGKADFLHNLITGNHGKVVSAAVGGAALLLLGPIGVSIGGATGGLVKVNNGASSSLGSVQGAVIGSVGKVTVDGMKKDKLKKHLGSLLPETSALVAVFSEVIVSKHKFNHECKTEKGGVDILMELMDNDITNKLKNHLDVAYHIIVLEDGSVMSQVIQASSADDFKKVVMSPDNDATTALTETFKDMSTKDDDGEVVIEEDEDIHFGITIAESASFETKAVLASLAESHLKKEQVIYTGQGVAGAAATTILGETIFYMAEDKDCELMA